MAKNQDLLKIKSLSCAANKCNFLWLLEHIIILFVELLYVAIIHFTVSKLPNVNHAYSLHVMYAYSCVDLSFIVFSYYLISIHQPMGLQYTSITRRATITSQPPTISGCV